MIDLTFAVMKDGKQQTAEVIIITIFLNKELRFAMMKSGVPQYSTIEGLKLNPSTIVSEFPDLEGQPEMYVKKEGIKRFKEHIKSIETMEGIKQYLTEDLAKHGYKLIMSQRKGFRPVREK